MAIIHKRACAGTLESSDVYVEVEPGAGAVELRLESVVLLQYGDAIRQTVEAELRRLHVDSVKIRLADRGALDCVIRARVEAAILRGSEVL